jgi:hypothetical protein
VEIKNELIDELLKVYQKPEDIIGKNGLLKRLVKAVLERAVGGADIEAVSLRGLLASFRLRSGVAGSARTSSGLAGRRLAPVSRSQVSRLATISDQATLTSGEIVIPTAIAAPFRSRVICTPSFSSLTAWSNNESCPSAPETRFGETEGMPLTPLRFSKSSAHFSLILSNTSGLGKLVCDVYEYNRALSYPRSSAARLRLPPKMSSIWRRRAAATLTFAGVSVVCPSVTMYILN